MDPVCGETKLSPNTSQSVLPQVACIELKITELLNHRYELGYEIGAGISAKVFLALDHETKTNVVIKRYEKWNSSKTQFQREVKNLKFLNAKDVDGKYVYNNVDNFSYDGHHCIVLDYYQGTTLEHEIKATRRRGLPTSLIKKILMKLLETFAFLEQIDLIHGDLKVCVS
jgi:serine/threonine protein kinase